MRCWRERIMEAQKEMRMKKEMGVKRRQGRLLWQMKRVRHGRTEAAWYLPVWAAKCPLQPEVAVELDLTWAM
jgi:hypothetical protein